MQPSPVEPINAARTAKFKSGKTSSTELFCPSVDSEWSSAYAGIADFFA